MRQHLLIYLIIIGITNKAITQSASIPILGYSQEIIVPFDYQQGFIIIDLVLQKALPLKFIVDTGAENTILLKKSIGDALRLPYHKRIELLGADVSEPVGALISNGVFLQLANCQPVRENIIVLENNYILLEQFLGKQIDGILGAEFFKELVMRIDYQNRELTLINPKSNFKKYIRSHDKQNIQIVDNKPYLDCKVAMSVGKKTNAKLLIDTGAGITFMLHSNTDTLLNLPTKIVAGSLGKGLGGDIMGFSGKAYELSFGNFQFNNAFCNFQDIAFDSLRRKYLIRNGIIGNLLLERFDVVIDFVGSKMYLKAKKNYNKSFDYDKSGLIIFAFGPSLREYFINEVIPGTPAADAGLQRGDIIVKVGILSTSWMSLKQINRKFTGKDGKTIKLKIKRGNYYTTKEIVLRDLF